VAVVMTGVLVVGGLTFSTIAVSVVRDIPSGETTPRREPCSQPASVLEELRTQSDNL
jgi:hypothetical protein